MKNSFWLFVGVLSLLAGCGPTPEELAAKGFSSRQEMEQYRAQGYDSKPQYLEKSLAALGEKLIALASSEEKTRPHARSIAEGVFKACKFDDVFELSAMTARSCGLGLDGKFDDPMFAASVNISYDLLQTSALQVTRVVTRPQDRLSMFSSMEGMRKEPVQCEFIDAESDASNDVSVNLISVHGLKKFTVREEFKELKDRREHITTIYYNTSRNCKILESRHAGLIPIDGYARNPVFDDPSLPDAVRKVAMNGYMHGLVDVTVEKVADINQDGHEDYIAYGGPGYCGSAGCNHLLIQSSNTPANRSGDVTYAVVFDGNVHQLEFMRNPKSRVVFVAHMHGSECGKAGAEPCKIKFVWYRNKYMKEDDVIALTEIIPADRTAFCGLVNGRVVDQLKRSSDKSDIQTLRAAYMYFNFYGEYMSKNHLQKFSREFIEKIKLQVLALDRASLTSALTQCNRDRRVTAQRDKR